MRQEVTDGRFSVKVWVENQDNIAIMFDGHAGTGVPIGSPGCERCYNFYWDGKIKCGICS